MLPDAHLGFDCRQLAREIQAGIPSLRHVLVAGDAGEFLALESVRGESEPLPPPDPGDAAFFLLSGGTTAASECIAATGGGSSRPRLVQ